MYAHPTPAGQPSSRFLRRWRVRGLLLGALAICALPLPAAPPSAGLAVRHPATTPCVVQLFPRWTFAAKGNAAAMDGTPRAFRYAPPARCKAPWAKVVLQADFSVPAGRQYDRTATIGLKGANIYFGTTEEPSQSAGASWQVERDLTGYSALLRNAGTGQVTINNVVDATHREPIFASARILFYPAGDGVPAPAVPAAVLPLNLPDGQPANVQTGADVLARSLVFPRNTRAVFIDVTAQPQFHDEFYYLCLPEPFRQPTAKFALLHSFLDSPKTPIACGGGSFREVEVIVDGQPAGLAPVKPLLFTGGIDPFLWRPTPGVETLDFTPSRVDLTPFAGPLSDGRPHTIAVRVLGANHYFALAASVLVDVDPGVAHTGGKLVRNTLADATPAPRVTDTLRVEGERVNGEITTRADSDYVIEGYVDTGAGRVTTRVTTSLRFRNEHQYIDPDGQAKRHVVTQATHLDTTSRSTLDGKPGPAHGTRASYTLNVNTRRTGELPPAGTLTRNVQLEQVFDVHAWQSRGGRDLYRSHTRQALAAADEIDSDLSTDASPHRGQSSRATSTFTDSDGRCTRSTIEVRDNRVTHQSEGIGCPAEP